MSGTLPDTNFEAINLQSNQKTLFSETDSGKSFRRQIQGQRFSFTISYPPMKRSDFAPIMAFIMKQRNRKEDFTITMPSYFNKSPAFNLPAPSPAKPSIAIVVSDALCEPLTKSVPVSFPCALK